MVFNIFKLVQDKRNILHFFDLFKKKEENLDVNSIYLSFTLDLEKHKNQYDKKQLDKILNFLKDYGKGTFFVETSLLENNSIHLGKHEVGSHGYGHLALGDNWWISKKEKSKNKLKNIKKSTELIKDKFKVSPVSFRCPKFSKSKEVNSILSKNGYKIDSSNHPHNARFLPKHEKSILEIPVSRYYKPRLCFKKIIPYLKYDSLMFSNLKQIGLKRFVKLSKKIAYSWPKSKVPLLVFMCHNWDFESDKDFKLFSAYVSLLQKSFKVKFCSLKEYYEITKDERS